MSWRGAARRGVFCKLTRLSVLHVHDEPAAEYVSVHGCAACMRKVARDGGSDDRAHE
jgi:hypothetical protein